MDAHRSHPPTGGLPVVDSAHAQGSEGRVIDPVCGMTVDMATARAKGLSYVHEGTEFGFCGRGCRLDFEEDPGRFLSPDHVPSM